MRLIRITLGILSLCLVAGTATAQDDTEAPLIDRGADELSDAVDVRPDDIDFVDTALVFSNATDVDASVVCIGYDADGNAVGTAMASPPANGLRFLFASDLSGGADFAGRVACKARGRVSGTAILLGPSGVSDLPSNSVRKRRATAMGFPVVVTR